MAKGAYIGVDGVARKVKKGYIGVDGKARKIKKAYIGIGGVARPCWAGGELTYYGRATNLTYGRTDITPCSTLSHVFFFGGRYAYWIDDYGYYITKINEGDAYNTSLTHTRLGATPSGDRDNLGSASIGDLAVFAGGQGTESTTGYNEVFSYNSAMTLKRASSNLSKAKIAPMGVSIGNYVLFAGGSIPGWNSNYSDVVEAYNQSLTKTTATALSFARSNGAAASVGNYAMFCCGAGLTNGSTSYSNVVDVYDTSLTKTNPFVYPYYVYQLYGVSAKGRAIFAGGCGNTSSSPSRATNRAEVYAYDGSLTRTTLDSLSIGRQGDMRRSACVEGFSMFLSTASGNNTDYTKIEVYDDSFVHTTMDRKGGEIYAGYPCAGASIGVVGNSALICGGNLFNTEEYSGGVDVYRVI